MRIMLSLSEEMHDALENERNQMMLKNTQDVVRLIISRHFNSEKQSVAQTKSDSISSLEDRCSYGDVPIQDTLAVFDPFIEIAQDLGETGDVKGVVKLFDLLWARVGALFYLNFQSPLSNARRQNLIEFLRDDDPTNARMRFVIGGLRGLINVDEIAELEPSLKVIMDIILAHISQSASRDTILQGNAPNGALGKMT